MPYKRKRDPDDTNLAWLERLATWIAVALIVLSLLLVALYRLAT